MVTKLMTRVKKKAEKNVITSLAFLQAMTLMFGAAVIASIVFYSSSSPTQKFLRDGIQNTGTSNGIAVLTKF